MKTVAVVQARLGSKRLPGKVLMDLGGLPMVWQVLRRVLAMRNVDKVVLAIPKNDVDLREAYYRHLPDLDSDHKSELFVGEEHDVASRFAVIGFMSDATILVRVTGDCPFFDPAAGEQVVGLVKSGRHVYASNTHPGVDGLDCEAFRTIPFLQHYGEVSDMPPSFAREYCLEHVTIGFRNGPLVWQEDGTYVQNCVAPGHYAYFIDHANLKLSVDDNETYLLAKEMYSYLQDNDYSFLHTLEVYKRVMNGVVEENRKEEHV